MAHERVARTLPLTQEQLQASMIKLYAGLVADAQNPVEWFRRLRPVLDSFMCPEQMRRHYEQATLDAARKGINVINTTTTH
jgi:hypothetical protein